MKTNHTDLKSSIHLIGLSESTITTPCQPSQVIPIHKYIGSFYLPNSTEGLPFFYIGVNTNLSKEFKQFPFTLEKYLNKSLQSKRNSSAFPEFKLIEASSTNNNTLAGFPAYEIVWTYKHPTYGMRKLVEFGSDKWKQRVLYRLCRIYRKIKILSNGSSYERLI